MGTVRPLIGTARAGYFLSLMGDTANDPVDHARTTRKYAGETMKNTRSTPGLAASALAVLALVVGLYLFGIGRTGAGVIAIVIAAVAGAAGAAWLMSTHRRVVRESGEGPPTA